ncbi:hypothetical protein H6G20_15985 [Desertifilum sp. FACHB-1129]|uniref:Uncharacterized protein n=1 Tax=Desertifilum tharense IPPAS B-1220 TaxID=1781255 RepID=A0A1E5QR65_9CYAN|nr:MULTISPECIES: hypothetical protein [Desertifilum]MDA0212113.1 hypothetical protein [Cyanobacteria bacterium FC1]MBD2313169.1 hypothetical protein [Desertifilum sp. FACHB-1129]MBD2323568.1 hypothetical protein [Desertifilum sp. FACHB-866]MBD2334071.1 hypothetical protein [Desertifilum sp. FACHB-868]OEJ77150.1 hypothetical protein BH720_00275 [Desertifilum tharense IPPAS B-1220]
MQTVDVQIEQLLQMNRAQSGERIVAVISDFYGSRWIYLEEIENREQFLLDAGWQTGGDVLKTVLSIYRNGA